MVKDEFIKYLADAPNNTQKFPPEFPTEDKKIGWICPKCGNSNSPYIFSCDKCSSQPPIGSYGFSFLDHS